MDRKRPYLSWKQAVKVLVGKDVDVAATAPDESVGGEHRYAVRTDWPERRVCRRWFSLVTSQAFNFETHQAYPVGVHYSSPSCEPLAA